MKSNFAKLVLTATLLTLTACSDKNKTPDDFTSFASNLIIEETEACDQLCVDRKKEFRYVVHVGKNVYAYWNEKQTQFNMNFEEYAEKFESQITSKTTEYDYYIILNKWAALFNDGHVNVMLRDDLSEIELYSTPVRFELLAPGTDHETLIVSRVGAGITQLKVGMIVDRIQDKNWYVHLDAAEAYASGSTPQMRRRSAANYIPRLLLEQQGPMAFKVEGRFNGKDISEMVPRNLSLYDGKPYPEEPEATGIDDIKAMVLDNNIGYLRINAFGGTKMSELLEQAMDRLSQTSGLIIDVRTNGGGDLSGNAVLARLAKEKIVRFTQKCNFSDMLQALRPSILFDYDYVSGIFSETKSRFVKPSGPDNHYGKPVYVLTSPYCFSACDTFVSALKENKLATVVGEKTGGGTGNPIVFSLPYSEHSFRYSVAQGYTAVGGTLLEGVGTSPDIVLEPTVAERATGTDAQLEKAAALLSAQIKNTPTETESFNLTPILKNVATADLTDISFDVEMDRQIKKNHD